MWTGRLRAGAAVIDGRPVAAVTGAARGIGAAVVSRLAADGYAVLALDLPGAARPPPEAGRVDRALDVGDPAAVLAFAGATDRLDVLVNNAGVFARTPLDADHGGAERAVLAVNADGPRRMTDACLPLLRRAGSGAVVNVASVRALTACERAAAYSVSKAMLIDLTAETAARAGGVRCNAVAPGEIATAMTPADPALLAALVARVPLGRLGRPEEVAAAVAFLASPRARAINGAILPVDGGFLCT